MTDPLAFSSILFFVALAAGALPLVCRWSDRSLHKFIAFSCGIFLGAVFLHLLPEIGGGGGHSHGGPIDPSHAEEALGGHGEAGEVCDVEGHEHDAEEAVAAFGASAGEGKPGGIATEPGTLWLFVLIGVLLVYLIETLLIRGPNSADHDHGSRSCGDEGHGSHESERQHTLVSYAAFAGLGVHALTAGFGMVVVLHNGWMGWPLSVSMILHKGTEAFSLGTIFVLSSFRRPKVLGLLAVFALTTPVGILAGSSLLNHLDPSSFGILTALAAGTFLYVSLCELLPEVFHHRVDVGWKVLLLSVGVAVMYLLHAIVIVE